MQRTIRFPGLGLIMPVIQASPKEVGGSCFCRNWKVGTLGSAIPGMSQWDMALKKGRLKKLLRIVRSPRGLLLWLELSTSLSKIKYSDHKANFFCLAVLKECPPFQSSWSVLNLPFTDWQNFVLKSLVPWFLPFSRSLEGGQLFFHPNSFHIALLSGKLAQGISLSLNQNKLWLSLSRKRQCGC